MGKTENCSPQSLFNFVYNPAPYGGSRHLTWGISIFNVYILIASIVIFVTDTHTQENKQCYKILRVNTQNLKRGFTRWGVNPSVIYFFTKTNQNILRNTNLA